jgi:thiamine biosynthesis lipoprotein
MAESRDCLARVSRRAMACEFEVCFPAASHADGTRAALDALDLVEELEEQLSYFRPGSQISRINALAADGPVEVEPWLFELLLLAERIRQETAGAYDITSAPLWEAWGFARRAGRPPNDAELAAARSLVGGQMMELDADASTVRFHRRGMKLNLGGIGKGYALDRCGAKLVESGMRNFLLHGGQSSVLARGGTDGTGIGVSGVHCPSPHSPFPSPLYWEIGVSDPRRPGRRLGILRLADRAIGTTSSQFQSFRHQGRLYGHVIDPRSGLPAESTLSVTVVAPTAALADGLSTAFAVLGADESREYCRRRPEIGMVMVCPGQAMPELHVAGVAEGEFQPIEQL